MNSPNPFINQIQVQLTKDEIIIWEGQPKPKFTITLLEMKPGYDLVRFKSTLGFVFAGILFFGYRFYTTENWLAFVITFIIGGFALCIPEILKHKRKQHTKYVMTNKRIFFQLWNFGKITIHSIDLKDVAEVRMETYEDKSGILHFLPKKTFGFQTKDFVSGDKRHYPTFEMIENVEKIYKELDSLRKKN